MTLTQLISDIYSNFKGKASKAPSEGTTKWNDAMAAANILMRAWARDPNVKWNSLFEERTFGTIAAGTQDYSLDDDVLDLADYVYVDNTDGSTTQYSVVKPQQRGLYSQCVYMTGLDGNHEIHFQDTISSGQKEVGGTIRAGIYAIPDDMVDGTDEVPVDDPGWLSKATAAELANAGTSTRPLFPDLIGEANNLYQNMINRNFAAPFDQPNQVANRMPQIGMPNL